LLLNRKIFRANVSSLIETDEIDTMQSDRWPRLALLCGCIRDQTVFLANSQQHCADVTSIVGQLPFVAPDANMLQIELIS